MRQSRLILALVLMLSCAPAWSQFGGERRPPAIGVKPPFAIPKELKPGKKYWQRIEYYRAKTPAPAPLVVVLASGSSISPTSLAGWMRYRLNREGYAVAFIGYDATVPKAREMAGYYASAITFLRGRSAELNIDPDRIVLIGTGITGHLATLLGTDAEYAEKSGVPFASIRGVVSLWGRGFDIPRRVEQAGFIDETYRTLFGTDPAEQAALSPASHLDEPNAPAFLFMAADTDRVSKGDSSEMAAALADKGPEAKFVELPVFQADVRQTYFMIEPDGSGEELLPFLRAHLGAGQTENP